MVHEAQMALGLLAHGVDQVSGHPQTMRLSLPILAVVAVIPHLAAAQSIPEMDEAYFIEKLKQTERFQKEFEDFFRVNNVKEIEAKLVELGHNPISAKGMASNVVLQKAEYLGHAYRAVLSGVSQVVKDYAILLLKETAAKGDEMSLTYLSESVRHADGVTARKALEHLASLGPTSAQHLDDLSKRLQFSKDFDTPDYQGRAAAIEAARKRAASPSKLSGLAKIGVAGVLASKFLGALDALGHPNAGVTCADLDCARAFLPK